MQNTKSKTWGAICGLQNPRYKLDGVSSIKGYKAVRPPSWYTGYVSRGFVREHILLVCEKFGWTQLPKGYKEFTERYLVVEEEASRVQA